MERTSDRWLIAGEWRRGDGEAHNLNPSDLDEVVSETEQGGAGMAREAVAAASDAFKAWSRATPSTRADVLDKAGSLVLERREDLGRLLSREEGKVLAEGVGEATRAGQILKYFAGEAMRMTGERLDSTRAGVDVAITREPVGVVALITPWNFPLAIPAWKIAPALAFGNTVVFKPSELSPASATALVEILLEAGLPAGVLNMAHGPGAEIGGAWLDHPGVNAVSMTGSASTGRQVVARAAQNGKRVQAEMGGKNPLIVLDDADLEVAVAVALNGSYFSTGQRCTASSRLIVTEAIHDRFVEAMVREMSALRVGPALDPSSQIGPVVSPRQLEGIESYLALARQEGAQLVGGQRVEAATRGCFLAPALLLESRPEMRVNREEIFGPVAGVIRVADLDEAISVANDTEFGLAAGICTTSLSAARRFQREAEAGMVTVNLPTAGADPHVPFGGRKASSYGPREQGAFAREFYTQVKTAYVN